MKISYDNSNGKRTIHNRRVPYRPNRPPKFQNPKGIRLLTALVWIAAFLAVMYGFLSAFGEIGGLP